MIKFSIIIPLYNKQNYIQLTLKSVLAQTYTEFEIIVVDDGSTDNSLREAEKIVDGRVRIFTKENEGVSAARNFGIEKAQYEYISFLDADDLWLPYYLECVSKLIELYPVAGTFATSYYINKNKDNVRNTRSENDFRTEDTLLIKDYCKSLIKREIVPLWTGAVSTAKKTIDEAGGFPVGVKRGEDLDMWLRLSLRRPVAFLNSPHAIYNQISENNSARMYKSYKESYPYWMWYKYRKSTYTRMFATNMIIELMNLALSNKYYNDVIVLSLKARGIHRILRRLFIFAKALLKVR